MHSATRRSVTRISMAAVWAAARAALIAGAIGIPAGLYGAGTAIAPFALPDQSGKPMELAPSPRYTLVTFYRGDW